MHWGENTWEKVTSHSGVTILWFFQWSTFCTLCEFPGKATKVGAVPGITKSIQERIKVSMPFKRSCSSKL